MVFLFVCLSRDLFMLATCGAVVSDCCFVLSRFQFNFELCLSSFFSDLIIIFSIAEESDGSE